MSQSVPPVQKPFSPVSMARHLLRTARTAALATLDAGSLAPFASLVTLATAPDGSPLMLLSTLAAHTRNLLQDPRASLLIDDRSTFTGNDALAGARMTVTGRIVPVATGDGAEAETIARRRFLARHPEAAGYAGFADFALYRLEVGTTHLVAGFGRINDIAASDLLTDVTGAEPLIAAEPDVIQHMNDDHAEAARAYAVHLLAQSEAVWRVIGCDPGGLDLAAEIDGRWHDTRLAFPVLVRGPGPLRAVLKELAEEAGKTAPASSI